MHAIEAQQIRVAFGAAMQVLLQRQDRLLRGDFQGAWDNPTGDAFAGLVPDEQHDRARQIHIWNVARENRGGDLRRLWRVDACADSLIYPVFFPHGTLGWHPELMHSQQRADALRPAREARVAARRVYSTGRCRYY